MNPSFEMIVETEMEKYRYKTWATKEPETLEWITSFGPHDIFYDIGANIGIYTLYAASLLPASMIYAVEPDPRNYKRLRENVEKNGYHHVQCYQVAMSSRHRIDNFYVCDLETGASGGQIGAPIDESGEHFEPKESNLITTMDFYWLRESWHIYPPNHIKIDVDGHEGDILEGFYPICNEKVKSLLVEFNGESAPHVEKLRSLGFTIDNRFNRMKKHSRFRREREGIAARNIVFTRG